MKLSFLIPFFLCALLYLSCKEAGISDSAAEQVRKEVRETLTNYHTEIRNEGLMAELKYLDTSAQFQWIPPGYEDPISYDSVVTILNRSVGLHGMIDSKWDSLTIEPISDTKANYSGIVSIQMTGISGEKSTAKLREQGVMIKRENGWKLLSGKTEEYL